MQVVILAAGKGKRMNGLTDQIPKSMLKVNGKPILEHKLEMLPKSIKEIVFVVGYCGEYIMNYFKKNHAGRNITYIFQHKLNGTGGALHLAKSVLKDRFLVMMGDDLYHKRDIKSLLRHELAVLGKEVEDSSQFGIIKKNRRGFLSEIVEKPKKCSEKLANAGLYVLNKKFFDYDLVGVGNGEFGLPQSLARMAEDYPVKVEKATQWFPINTAEDLKGAEEAIKKFFKK